MPEQKIDVELSHPWEGHAVGERVSLDTLTAKRVVRAGVGVYATKAAATEAEGEAGAEKTKAAVRKRGG